MSVPYSSFNPISLGNLINVKIDDTTLANGNTIVYNSTTGLWDNGVEGGEVPLTFSTGLTRTVNTITNNLSTGVAGGQTAIGGTGVTDILKLKGTTGNGTSASPAIQAIVGNNGATTALTILNSGNVGIGTTTPAFQLELGDGSTTPAVINIKGSGTGLARYRLGSGSNSAEFSWNETGSASPNGIPTSALGIGTNQNFPIVIATSNTERMRITGAGNVGIGTTTPSTILDVVGGGGGKFTTAVSKTQLTVNGTGAIQSGINFANGGTNYGEIYFDNNAPYNMSIYQKYSTGSLILGTNTTERMRITSAGKVGIGTTAPDQLLHLKDSVNGFVGIHLEGSNGSVDATSNFSGADFTIYVSSDPQNSSNDFLGFFNNSTTDSASTGYKMVITKLGNVLIGTTTAAVNEKLRISGDVGSNSPSVAFTSANSNISVPSGVATTIYTFPTQSRIIFYEVFVRLDTGGSPAQYAGMTTLAVGGGTIKQMSVVNGALLVLTVSGLDLQVTQSSGATQNVMTSVRQTFATSGF